MTYGTADYYNSDAQLTASLAVLGTIVGRLDESLAKFDTSISALGDILTQLETTLTVDTPGTGNLLDKLDALDGTMDGRLNLADLNASDVRDLLATLRSQAMGDATSLHDSDTGTVGTTEAVKIAAWTGRTGFSVTQTGTGSGILYAGGSAACAMASLHAGGNYVNETYCGAIYFKGTGSAIPYAFEEW